MNIKDKLDFLQIKEVTTKQQKKNGTREFKLPVKDRYGTAIHVASFASGYVRRTKAGGYCPSWQINKTKKEKRYVEMTDYDTGRPVIRTFNDTVRVLIEDEQERLEYLITFCLKNYYIGQANMLSKKTWINGEFVDKWKYDEAIKLGEEYAREPEVKVIVNGHRYNVI
jgi:hypothetical protein